MKKSLKLTDPVLDELLKDKAPEEVSRFLENLFLERKDVVYLQKIATLLVLQGKQDVFLKLFVAPEKDRAPPNNPALKLPKKDYNQYLNNLIFDFALSDECYLFLYRYTAQNFSKRLFKRVLTHQGFFKPAVHNPKLVQEVVRICQKEKLNDSLFDFAQLLQELDLQSLNALARGLAQCKHHEPVLLAKMQAFLRKHPLGLAMFQPYVEEVLRLGQHKAFMAVFEALKLHQLARRFEPAEELPAERLAELQKDFRAKNARELNAFYTDFIAFLNARQCAAQAQLCFQDMLQQKFPFRRQDYLNGLIGNQIN